MCVGIFALLLAGLVGISLVNAAKVQEATKLQYDGECKLADRRAEAKGEDTATRNGSFWPPHSNLLEHPAWTPKWSME